jgi:hypothetical protein
MLLSWKKYIVRACSSVSASFSGIDSIFDTTLHQWTQLNVYRLPPIFSCNRRLERLMMFWTVCRCHRKQSRYLTQSYLNRRPTDVRNIISDDDSLQDGVLPALLEYNLAQFTTVEVPGTDHQAYCLPTTHVTRQLTAILQSIVSEAARWFSSQSEEDRFFDPRSKTSFRFDHLSLVSWLCFTSENYFLINPKEASDPQPVEIDVDSEPFRLVKLSCLGNIQAHILSERLWSLRRWIICWHISMTELHRSSQWLVPTNFLCRL